MSRAADNFSTFSLDEARRQPDWPEERIVDELRAGRLPLRGYIKGKGWITNELIEWDRVTKVDWTANKVVLTFVAEQGVGDVGLYDVTIVGVTIGLPTEAPAEPAAPKAGGRRRMRGYAAVCAVAEQVAQDQKAKTGEVMPGQTDFINAVVVECEKRKIKMPNTALDDKGRMSTTLREWLRPIHDRVTGS